MEYRQHLYKHFATLLEYPTPALVHEVGECLERLSSVHPSAAEIFSEFGAWVRQTKLDQIKEVYTCTFDLQGICCPYVGHYLFGDNYQRSWFMAKLNEGYRARGFSSGAELPDHIAILLHFLERGDEDEFSQVLLWEGLMPALEKMIQMFEESGRHPYGQLLQSLGMWLTDGMVKDKDDLVKAKVGGLAHD